VAEGRRFVFAPLERRGVVAGLGGGQLGVLAAGLIAGVSLLRSRPTPLGIAGAVVASGAGAICALADIGGRPTVLWAPLVSRYAIGRVVGRHRTRPRAPRAGRPPFTAPRPLARLSFADVEGPAGPVGVVTDRTRGLVIGVLEASGGSFSLLDSSDQESALDAWARVLAAVAREGSPVARLQWVHHRSDGDVEPFIRHFAERQRVTNGAAADSYADLLTESSTAFQATASYVAIAVSGRSVATLLRELRLLEGQLRHAGLEVRGPLSSRALCGLIRIGYDPASKAILSARVGDRPDWSGSAARAAWPAATATHWSAYRTDEFWHATFWVAEWPRTEVAPGFLNRLLLNGSVTRRVSVVMAASGAAQAFREAETARTAGTADEELRRRAGFLATARRRREMESVVRREAELTDGHVAYRFSGYVTVSAESREALEEACSETLHIAHQCRLDLRRLVGLQDVAFAWTLPLAGGLA
jgi:hypothetical protein